MVDGWLEDVLVARRELWNEGLGSPGWSSLSDCTQRGCRTVTSVWTAHWSEHARLSELGLLRASRVTPKDSMICQCRYRILGGCMTRPPEIAAPLLAGVGRRVLPDCMALHSLSSACQP